MAPPVDVRALLDAWVERGHITGHALAICDACGMGTMLSLVGTSGTRRGLKSEPWPRCLLHPRCEGRRVITADAARDVPRVRPPVVGRTTAHKRAKQRTITSNNEPAPAQLDEPT